MRVAKIQTDSRTMSQHLQDDDLEEQGSNLMYGSSWPPPGVILDICPTLKYAESFRFGFRFCFRKSSL